MKKIVVLNSGGFDSTILLKFLKEEYNSELHSLYFSYGQINDVPAAECAKFNADKYCKSHKVITLPRIDWTNSEFYSADYKSTEVKYLEARNLIFISYAVSYAESIKADTVTMALIKDGANMYNDCSRAFAKKVDRLCREFGVSFKAPFIEVWKDELFDMAAAFRVDPESFISCDTTINGKPCGNCPDCKAISLYKEKYDFLK